MHISRSAIFSAFLAAALVEATSTLESHCYTTYSSASVSPVPTSSRFRTVTDTFTSTENVHPTTIIHPSPVTSTVYVSTDSTTTTITDSTHTDTAIILETLTRTRTKTADVTYTTWTSITKTSTYYNPTTTIDAPSGFLPIQTSLPNSSQKLKHKRDALGHSFRVHAKKREVKPAVAAGSRVADRYPNNVRCNVLEHQYETTVVTNTESTVTRTARTPTSTVRATTTETSTLTVFPPDVSTTVTSTSILRTYITSTPTETQTYTYISFTSTAPYGIETYYAQCAPNNMASRGPNGPLQAMKDEEYSKYIYTTASSAYNCCVACVLDPLCGWGAFYLPNMSTCELYEHSVCKNPGQYQYLIYEYTSNPSAAGANEFFNGNCVEAIGYTS